MNSGFVQGCLSRDDASKAGAAVGCDQASRGTCRGVCLDPGLSEEHPKNHVITYSLQMTKNPPLQARNWKVQLCKSPVAVTSS